MSFIWQSYGVAKTVIFMAFYSPWETLRSPRQIGSRILLFWSGIPIYKNIGEGKAVSLLFSLPLSIGKFIFQES